MSHHLPALEFWFEFGSTYSYPAAMRLQALAEQAGVTVAWRPFLLGPIFAEQGMKDSPFNLYPAKGQYMWRDLERICGQLGLPFQRPSVFPRSGLLAARIACAFSEQPWQRDFVRAVYQANFARDEDIADVAVLAACLQDLGLEAQPILDAAAGDAAKASLRAQNAEAQTRGIFGAPSFWVDGELFWGNDRLEDALAWACR